MTSKSFFFIFIPMLAVILLLINIMFAPHHPYKEKNSVFECGFHSFLGQNRTEFTISFFVFALLFLLFDLEILLIYPYVVSTYMNGTYGFTIMLIFFILLTLGLAFELGKKALYIESKQLKRDIPSGIKCIRDKWIIMRQKIIGQRDKVRKIIFIVLLGLIIRFLINNIWEIDIFKEYLNPISLSYFTMMASINVYFDDLIDYTKLLMYRIKSISKNIFAVPKNLFITGNGKVNSHVDEESIKKSINFLRNLWDRNNDYQYMEGNVKHLDDEGDFKLKNGPESRVTFSMDLSKILNPDTGQSSNSTNTGQSSNSTNTGQSSNNTVGTQTSNNNAAAQTSDNAIPVVQLAANKYYGGRIILPKGRLDFIPPRVTPETFSDTPPRIDNSSYKALADSIEAKAAWLIARKSPNDTSMMKVKIKDVGIRNGSIEHEMLRKATEHCNFRNPRANFHSSIRIFSVAEITIVTDKHSRNSSFGGGVRMIRFVGDYTPENSRVYNPVPRPTNNQVPNNQVPSNQVPSNQVPNNQTGNNPSANTQTSNNQLINNNRSNQIRSNQSTNSQIINQLRNNYYNNNNNNNNNN